MKFQENPNEFHIDLSYDSEARIWVGASKDIPGLFLEADSFAEFLTEANDIAPYLISHNLDISEGEAVINIAIDESAKPAARNNSLNVSYFLRDVTLDAVEMKKMM